MVRRLILGLVPSVLAAQAPPVHVSPNLRMIPGAHNETWVAVSPADPDVLIAAAQQGDGNPPLAFQVSTAVSRDGGRVWSPVRLPGAPPTPFDPMVAAGPDGRLYVIMGVIGGAFGRELVKDAPAKQTMLFWSSMDKGFTWDGPSEPESSVDPDHMRITVDMSSAPTRGRIWMTWNDGTDRFVRDHYEVFAQWSDDHGKTFTPPVLIATGTDGKLVATEPVVLSDGTVMITYYQYWNPLARRENERMPMFVVRSSDGGKTWSKPTRIFQFGPHAWRERAAEFSRAFSLPIFTADTSSTSPNRDHVYATWDDVSDGTSSIWFIRSTDKGATWAKPIKINDNRPAMTGPKDYRMTPVVAVSPAGIVAVAWYDRRNDPNRMCWDYMGAFSTDGGSSFGANFKISSVPSCPPPGTPPTAAVHNLGKPLTDPDVLPDSLLERRSLLDRLQVWIPRENQAARDEANRDLTSGRLTISFDPSRNVWPGHYTGLAADRNGVFHAVWLDRRNGSQELFTARVTPADQPRPSDLVEQDVSMRVAVIAETPSFDKAKNAVTLSLQVRNVGREPLYGPIKLAMKRVGSRAAIDTTVTFTGRLGTGDRLLPRDLSEPVSVTFRVLPETGFDAAFDFRVTALASGRRRE